MLFSGISADEYARIAATARVKHFERRQMICFEGDEIQQVFLLTAGSVKATQVGESGAEVILKILAPGDVVGALSLFSTGRHSRTVQAFELCRVLAWDAATFKSLVTRYPALHHNIVRILGEHLRELEERFHEVATEKVGPRVARQLVRLKGQIGRRVQGGVDMGLSREDLAQMTGTNLFTVSRLLSAWEARGWVRCGRNAVTVCDPESLLNVSS